MSIDLVRSLGLRRLVMTLTAVALLAAACGDDGDQTTADAPDSSPPTSITLVTHDSFALSDGVLDGFTERTGIEVELLSSGDAGQMVSEAILTAGNPLGDVMFGVDNTFLQRALDAELFVPHESPALADVPDEFELDDEHRVTPIDYGDVCVNYWIDEVDASPQTLDDLVDPSYAGQLVVQNPETSSPGLAFLLATIAGTDDWESFWTRLRDNDVLVTPGWTEAYTVEFTAGGGDRPLVVSYASSPPVEVLFAEPAIDEAPTGVLLDSCFRQIEFAGILSGTEHAAEAAELIDYLLGPEVQGDLPLQMFVFPVVEDTELPEVFVEHARIADDPLVIAPEEIEANRDAWTERWNEIVLG